MKATGKRPEKIRRDIGKIFPGLLRYADMVVRTALAEDVGTGDITTTAVLKRPLKGACRIVAKEDLVLAGLFVAENVFKRLDRNSLFSSGYADGDTVKKGDTIATVSGDLGALLAGERVGAKRPG